MKRSVIILIILAICINKTKACDICGCGVSSYYNGILPDFKKKIMGFRYRFNSLKTHVGVGGIESYLTTTESYRSAELWGGWNIGKHFRVMTSIPYSFNERVNQDAVTKKQGIGDIAFAGYFQVFKQDKTVFHSRRLLQSLWIGGGIKLPTGEYNPAEKQGSAQNTNLFQLGTGSLDYMTNAMYDFRLQDAGININASYKMNGTNSHSYRYGNKLSATAQVYYKFRPLHNLSLAPNLGIVYEKAEEDFNNGFYVDISGGKVVLGTIGLEVAYNKLTFGGSWQTPTSQNLANGFVKTNNRLMLHISMAL